MKWKILGKVGPTTATVSARLGVASFAKRLQKEEEKLIHKKQQLLKLRARKKAHFGPHPPASRIASS